MNFYRMLKLIVDDREQIVLPFIKASYPKVSVEIKRMQIGDYSIMKENKILFSIERKTWKDLSASIKDGRDSNIDKMIELRNQTNCRLLLLIEGKARYNPETKFARIPYKNLQAKLDHLMIRDNVSIIYSKDTEDTVNRLVELCTNYTTMSPECRDNIEDNIRSESVGGDILDHEKILTTVIPKSDDTILRNIWACIPNVTNVTGSLFIQHNIHIADFLNGVIKSSDIEDIRYDSGAVIGKRAAKMLRFSKNTDVDNYKHYCNILSAIPGITKQTAAVILTIVSFKELLSGSLSVDDLATIKKTEKSKVGRKASESIYKYLIKMN